MFRNTLQSIVRLRDDRGFLLALRALLSDALLILLVALGALFTAESVLPGFASGRINLAKPIAIAAVLMVALIALGRHLGLAYEAKRGRGSRVLSWALALWAATLAVNALLAFPWWSILVILVLTFVIFHLFRSILRAES